MSAGVPPATLAVIRGASAPGQRTAACQVLWHVGRPRGYLDVQQRRRLTLATHAIHSYAKPNALKRSILRVAARRTLANAPACRRRRFCSAISPQADRCAARARRPGVYGGVRLTQEVRPFGRRQTKRQQRESVPAPRAGVLDAYYRRGGHIVCVRRDRVRRGGCAVRSERPE